MGFSILVCFVLALLASPLTRRLGKGAGWWLGAVPAVLLIFFLTQVSDISRGTVMTADWNWVSGLGVDLSFYLDGLSLLFTILVLSIGSVVVIYAGSYLSKDPLQGRFFSFVFLFMGAMLGLVLSANLVTLFIFWELTSVGSFLLIGYKHEKQEARDAAIQALLVTGLGGLALLGGVILIGQVYGSYEFSSLLADPGRLKESPLYMPVFLLICLAAFTKSAQFPFHFWLPGAMAAPAPVSTYLHSATMVKAGVYLLARINPVLGGTEVWHYTLTVAGAVTMLLGAAIALPQRDLKRLLAFSTVSALGMLVLLLGLDTQAAVKAAVVFLVVHAFYKSSLFLVVGVLDHEVGTRDRDSLQGLLKTMPGIGIASALAALSMAGLPPMLGFIGKELLYEAKIQAPAAAPLVTGAGVAANVFMVSLAVMVGIGPFFGTIPRPVFRGRIPFAMQLGPMVFAGASLIVGLNPGLVDGILIGPAVSSIRAEVIEVRLYLWHGISPVLLLSIATVITGLFLYTQRRRIFPVGDWLHEHSVPGPERIYQGVMDAFKLSALTVTRALQNGYLRAYVFLVVLSFAGMGSFVLLREGVSPGFWMGKFWPHEIAIATVILLAAGSAVWTRSRLTSVISVGVVGYGIALLFVFFGAPDLAMTQFLVETLTVVLFVYVLYRLPDFRRFSSPQSRFRDAAVAVLSGLIITALVMVVLRRQTPHDVSEFYGSRSWTEAYGRNVVNVILVDFRALDTLGEILVLSLAALGVYSLMNRYGRRN